LEKFCLPLGEGFANHAAPMQRVYELSESNSTDFELTPLQGMDKLTVLIRHTYRLNFIAGAPGKKRHFEQCGQAARSCQVGRIVRPMYPFRLAELADLVEKDWA
jgi:acyl CoA:acetate/3-ketoacid CoA transferase alpha subunit